jgi:hypothetical protein
MQLSNMASNFSHRLAVADTLATPLEDQPIEIGEKYLARGGLAARHASLTITPIRGCKRR